MRILDLNPEPYDREAMAFIEPHEYCRLILLLTGGGHPCHTCSRYSTARAR